MNGKEGNSTKMHELFMQVLKNRDLSRAGDLFSVADTDIVNDLTQVVSIHKFIMNFIHFYKLLYSASNLLLISISSLFS